MQHSSIILGVEFSNAIEKLSDMYKVEESIRKLDIPLDEIDSVVTQRLQAELHRNPELFDRVLKAEMKK